MEFFLKKTKIAKVAPHIMIKCLKSTEVTHVFFSFKDVVLAYIFFKIWLVLVVLHPDINVNCIT